MQTVYITKIISNGDCFHKGENIHKIKGVYSVPLLVELAGLNRIFSEDFLKKQKSMAWR